VLDFDGVTVLEGVFDVEGSAEGVFEKLLDGEYVSLTEVEKLTLLVTVLL
jgi:hypothetical protein